MAVATLVLGICSIIFGMLPVLGLIISNTALVFAIFALLGANKKTNISGMIIAGFITSIIGMTFSLLANIYIFFYLVMWN